MDVMVRLANALLMIGLPIPLALLLRRRFGLSWRLIGVGAATFIASQVLHIPFNALALNGLLERLGWSMSSEGPALVATLTLFGLSAGIFEEGARYLAYRIWIGDARRWDQALLFGAGHGGMEAVLFGGAALLAFVQAVTYRGVDLSSVVPANQVELAQAQLAAYWATPWPTALLGAVERAFALCLHLSLAVLVLQVFLRKELRWLIAAIAWHALANLAGLLALQQWGPWAAEGAIGLFAFSSVGIVQALRQQGPVDDALMQAEPGEVPPLPDKDLGAPRDKLDESRYFE